MNRTCVINIAGVSPRLLRAVGGLWINSLPGGVRPARPTLPALSACVQASMTTGAECGLHGIVAGGLYRRQSGQLSFDERSNTLLNKKRFWHSRRLGLPKTAMVFWTNPLAGAADVVLGAMTYGPSGVSLADQPVGLYDQIAGRIGPLDFSHMRGPRASWTAAGWIASAVQIIWREQEPMLQWVYLPGVDFEIVRHGVNSPQAAEALHVLDLAAHRIGADVLESGGQVVVLSDGGYVDVTGVSFPNICLRQAGLLKVVPTDLGEMVDLQSSDAFAMADHQVGHVFCRGDSAAKAAADALASCRGLANVLRPQETFGCGMGCERSGERVILSRPDTWLSYRWWLDDTQAPRPARRWDVQGKLGCDPCELFPALSGQAGEIDPNPSRVRASRGLVPSDEADFAFLATTTDAHLPPQIKITDVPDIVSRIMLG